MEDEFKHIATLIGDPVRATILWALMDGKAMTATELALTTGTSPQNISMHMAKLLQADLVYADSQGRHKYYKFARREVAYAIEAITMLIPHPVAKQSIIKSEDPKVMYCRTCYDHLAGKMGVAITDSLLRQRVIAYHKNALELKGKGIEWFTELGIDINELKQQRRSFLRPCLDWSERRPHIAGSLAAALLNMMLQNDWIRRVKNSRTVIITSKGQKAFYEKFRIVD